jgi:DNA replication protein DnaC
MMASDSTLLILDDWGLSPIKGDQLRDLLEALENRNGLHSTLVTNQLPVNRWFDYLGDPTLADAILDRLIHNAHRIPLRGESMRKHKQALICTENSNQLNASRVASLRLRGPVL